MRLALAAPTRPVVPRRAAAAIKRRIPLYLSPRAFVPSDSFGGRSPERVASDALRTLFTFIAAKIIMAQLEGSGRGGLAAYDKKGYDDLAAALATFNDEPSGGGGSGGSGSGGGKGDLWLEKLSKKNPSLALRLMEVRAAYAAENFEWENCRRLATEGLAAANLDILKARLGSVWAAAADDSSEEDDEGEKAD